MDWPLLGATVALIALGLMLVYSSSSDLGYRDYGDAAHFFKRQLVWLGIGLLAMLVVSRVPYRHWTKVSIPIMAITLLTLVFLVGVAAFFILFRNRATKVDGIDVLLGKGQPVIIEVFSNT